MMIRSSCQFLGTAGICPFHIHKWKKNSLPLNLFLFKFPSPIKTITTTTTTTTTATTTQSPDSLFSTVSTHSTRHFKTSQMSATRSDSEPDSDITTSSSTVLPSTQAPKPKINFCQSCGGPTKHVIPDGEEKMRAVCTLCGKIFYENPKMVVGCVVEHDNKVLLCKRKIQPSYGLWTLPAGFMEIGESAAEGASRETLEEACAKVEVLTPFAQLDIPRIAQYRVTSFSVRN